MRWLFDLFTYNWSLKLTAVVLAFLLWFAVRSETLGQAAIPGVSVDVDLQEEGWIFLPPPRPDTVTVLFAGPVRGLTALSLDRPRVVVPVAEVQDTVQVVALEYRHLRYRTGLDNIRPVGIEPGAVTLRFDRIVERAVPVTVVLAGTLPPGFRLAATPVAEPAAVQARGPGRALAALDSIPLAPIDLATLSGPSVLAVPVDTSGLGRLEVSPALVQVRVPLQPVPLDTLPSDTAADTLLGETVEPPDTSVDDTAAVGTRVP